MDTASALKQTPRHRLLVRLFWEYFKIALFVVGGGYAIIVAADDVFGRRLKWLREGELLDHLPVFQMIPGLIAGNSAIYVGLKVAGLTGVVTALTAVALPSLIIITLVAIGYSNLPIDNPYLQGAFVGLRAAITGLVFATLIKSWRKIMHGFYPFACVVVTLLLMLTWNWNVAYVLVGSMLFGILWHIAALPVIRRVQNKQKEAGK